MVEIEGVKIPYYEVGRNPFIQVINSNVATRKGES